MANSTEHFERPMVKTQEDLLALVADLRAAGRFALDTEFLAERTYVPRLCLIQVATDDFIALIDSIAVPSLDPFWELVNDPDIVKVLHAAREDLRLSYYGSRGLPQNVFDTQVAAGLIGLPQYPLSYARLVEALAGVRLGKTETRSEWDRRPLSPEQLKYARDDVRYLLPIADKLGAMLTKIGRRGWLDEEMARFSTAIAYEPDPNAAYQRIRGPRSGLTARPTALLRSVAAWREREAAARDMSARLVLKDEVVTELALRPPRRITDFVKVRGFPIGEETTIGPDILAALDAARAIKDEDLPEPLAGQDDETPQQRVMTDLTAAMGAALCLARGIAPELALTRASASLLVRGNPAATLLAGWRYEAIGRELQSFVTGASPALISVINAALAVKIEVPAKDASEAGNE
ncbi:ribonuclease D [Capsulimonas corticalis]|uniref:Ribonuclease D n=1 Tax=Capsulimonas corticalis TaxID=2219043 RepID=A0A402D520_9BACT|nr:HRDC domain-containing protein [Capsulimonas corticalis]BDI31935.1 ribonuclease D [Capsulimonas corticalis]